MKKLRFQETDEFNAQIKKSSEAGLLGKFFSPLLSLIQKLFDFVI